MRYTVQQQENTKAANSMNIGIRLHDTKGTSLAQHLASARDQGFSCAHIALSKTIPGFSMADAPALLTDEMAADVRRLLDEYGIHCAVLGCYLNLATPDEEELARTVACYKAHLRFAKAIGADVVGTETGAPNTGYKPCPECHTEESLRLFIDRLTPVVRYAEDIGAVIAIEPVCRHIVSTPERAHRVLQAVNSPALKIILDTVNLMNAANHAQTDALVEECIRRFGEDIRVLHMKDYRLEDGQTDVSSMACGTGVMRYDRLLRFAAAHPGLPMTLEDTIPDNAMAAREYLKRAAASL